MPPAAVLAASWQLVGRWHQLQERPVPPLLPPPLLCLMPVLRAAMHRGWRAGDGCLSWRSRRRRNLPQPPTRGNSQQNSDKIVLPIEFTFTAYVIWHLST